MATHTGSEGIVKVGSNTVAKVTGFSLSVSANMIADNAIDDAWESNNAGRKKWSGSINCNWNPADTSGQQALTIGASVTLNLYGNGATTGDTLFSGTALINEISRDWSDESMVKATFQFVGDGTLTESTVA